MITTTVTPETVFENLGILLSLLGNADDILPDSVDCAQCGYDAAFEKFGADFLCESCITLIGNVLASVQYGIEPDEDGNVSVIA